MLKQSVLYDLLIYSLGGVIGYWVTKYLADGMSASSAYAYIVSWWLMAYISAKCNISMLVAIPFGIGLFLICIIVKTNDLIHVFINHGFTNGTESLVSVIVVSLFHSFVQTAPILLNTCVDWILKKLRVPTDSITKTDM